MITCSSSPSPSLRCPVVVAAAAAAPRGCARGQAGPHPGQAIHPPPPLPVHPQPGLLLLPQEASSVAQPFADWEGSNGLVCEDKEKNKQMKKEVTLRPRE